MLSNQAQVAKIIRNHCKQIGIKCRAKSEGYSMGDSVRVTVYDQPPQVFDALNKLWSKYQYGHFDGMQDMYEYSNSRDDIPQTKYLFINNEFSEEIRQAAWDLIRATYADAQHAPESVKECNQARIGDEWGDQFLWRFLNGSGGYEVAENFWRSIKSESKAA